MAYENLGTRTLDYYPCRYGTSKILFRGPRRDLSEPYIAVLGGSETYGKFLEAPYPVRLETRLDVNCVNLGCVNAGVDVFQYDDALVDLANKARLTVLQVPGAQNMSNRFYAVHRRRNDRFLRASNLLKTVYREVDFTDFNFTRHLVTHLNMISPDKFTMIEEELKAAWTARMKALVSRIEGDVVLMWLSDHEPERTAALGIEAGDPLFVDHEMIEAIRPFVADYVEVIVSPEEISAGRENLIYGELEAPAAEGMLGSVAHDRAAAALEAAIRPLI